MDLQPLIIKRGTTPNGKRQNEKKQEQEQQPSNINSTKFSNQTAAT
jgi:hypothetical protein